MPKAAGGDFISFQWNSSLKILTLQCWNMSVILLFAAASQVIIYIGLHLKTQVY